jgi:hypothetical protein
MQLNRKVFATKTLWIKRKRAPSLTAKIDSTGIGRIRHKAVKLQHT